MKRALLRARPIIMRALILCGVGAGLSCGTDWDVQRIPTCACSLQFEVTPVQQAR